VPALLVDNVIDTTGAGDSYNGAYLSARIKGMNPVEAATAAHGLAAKVIGCRGAILPKESMSA
jgi:2-dehydro-3-deoxygluconokinase